MSVQSIQAGQRVVDVLLTGAQTQTSTNTYATVSGADIDARAWRTVAYTIVVATNAVTWQVLGANKSDYSDAVVAQAGASVAVGASSSYVANPAPFAFYRVQIESTVNNSAGSATVNGVGKG